MPIDHETESRPSSRSQLQAELARRQMINPQYSLRSFARDIGLSPAFVSKVLAGEKGLSLNAAAQVAERLGYSRSTAVLFCNLVQSEKVLSPKARELLHTADDDDEFGLVSLDKFQIMSDWYHYAILELSLCRGFQSNARYIAKKLGITEQQARQAVARLLRIGLLTEEKSRWKKTNRFLSTPTDQPDRALRNFHEQMIEKARRALHTQTVDERDITGVTLSIDARDLPRVKAETRKFLVHLSQSLDSGRPNRVVQVNIQLFALSESTESK